MTTKTATTTGSVTPGTVEDRLARLEKQANREHEVIGEILAWMEKTEKMDEMVLRVLQGQ